MATPDHGVALLWNVQHDSMLETLPLLDVKVAW